MAKRKKVKKVSKPKKETLVNVKITDKQAIKVGQRYKNAMRELWSKSTYRSQAMKRAGRRVKTGQKYKNGKDKYASKYLCNHCKHLFKEDYVEVDHIKELYRINWQIPFHENLAEIQKWTQSLFCDIENLQVLCKRCHTIKTIEYNKFLHLGGELL